MTQSNPEPEATVEADFVEYEDGIPPRISAALEFCRQRSFADKDVSCDRARKAADSADAAAYRCLTLYFLGECDG